MRKKYIPPDFDPNNDIEIIVNDLEDIKEIEKENKRNIPRFNIGDLVEYRYSSKVEECKPAMILENEHHNKNGHCLYKIFSTLHGSRLVHESLLFLLENK